MHRMHTTLLTVLLFVTLATSHAGAQANLIFNPGFEVGAGGWSLPTGAQVVQSAAHAGGQSLRIQAGLGVNPVVKQYIAVSPGCPYTFSAWIRTQNVIGGTARIKLEWYDASGKYIGGYGSEGLSGTQDWTQPVEVTTVIPDNTARIAALLYMTKGSTGTAWFDDIQVGNDMMFRSILRYPAYRGTIYPGRSKRVSVGIEFRQNTLAPVAYPRVNVAVLDRYGAQVGSGSKTSLSTTYWDNIKINLTYLAAGSYTVRVRLVNGSTGFVVRTLTLPLTIAASTTPYPKVYIDEYGRCVVDGKLFFPLGFYDNGMSASGMSDLDRISATKFNCIMNYTTSTGALKYTDAYLARAQSVGLKIIFSVKDCYSGTPWEPTSLGFWTGAFNIFKGLVETYKNHPALLAWYINDELSNEYLPQIADRYNYIKSSDPNHPAWQVMTTATNHRAHVDNTDVLGVDDYPVFQQYRDKLAQPPMSDFGKYTDYLRAAGMGARAIWMVPECSSQKPYNSLSQPPSFQQMMCLAYQGLIHGARGLVFFSLEYLTSDDGDAQFAAVRQLGDELDRIKPIALGIDAPTTLKLTVSDARISVLSRMSGSNLYMLAVNPYNETVTAAFKLGSRVIASSVRVGPPGIVQKTIPVTNGAFTDSLEPYGVRVYKTSAP
ncbi:MAG: carbohydrate binding domain-containing protein [Armatimonadetes bacterium]|nr:carbohydrate binding domain-containing protein [Armatimonadota bacterium]